MTLSSSTLREIQEAAQKATPGPWGIKQAVALQYNDPATSGDVAITAGDVERGVKLGAIGEIWAERERGNPDGGQALADAAFIAKANPSVVLAMAEEILRLREQQQPDLTTPGEGPWRISTEKGGGTWVVGPNRAYVFADNLREAYAVCAALNWAALRPRPEPGAADALRTEEEARTLTDGSPVTPDHRDIDPATGMQKAYVVLSAEERAKGFVRPVRRSYRHGTCGHVTTMGQALAETYAREPTFYSGTFCANCRKHFPVGPDGEFSWLDGQKVGT